jgi:hypothetical protein
MSRQQTSELHAWQRQDAQERVDRAIALLRDAQLHLQGARVHNMPRRLIMSSEWMVKLRLDMLWEAQQGKEQLKPVGAGYGISDRA